MDYLIGKLALIGALGAAAQWLAWRARLPAIVLLMAAGFIAGPLTGVLDPVRDFGDLLRPLIALAVALILFEGGLSLNFAELRETSVAVRRLVTLGAALAFGLGTLAGRYLATLSWPSALVLGALLVVTGPTVVVPLLRHARLTPAAASLLRWEAILADPIGALLAVVVLEGVLVAKAEISAAALAAHVGGAVLWAVAGGYGLGRLAAMAFVRGYVPEFLKAPVVVSGVLATYAVSDLILEESGLLTVTILGITLGNSRIASLTELRRFKELVTVLLVSGVFVILTAELEPGALASLAPRDALFIAALLLVVRPVSVLAATAASGVGFRERVLAACIAPRGVVAVAVSGLFAVALSARGVTDGERLVALTFAVVVITVVVHGFILRPVARLLGLASSGAEGVLIVGGSPWANALAERLDAMELPVMIADRNWSHLREARLHGIQVFYGEVLSELAEHHMDINRFGYLVAATDNDDYNALVCTDFGPEFGRGNVFQVGRPDSSEDRHTLAVTLGGRPLLNDLGGLRQLNARLASGWAFGGTTLEPGLRRGATSRSDGHGGSVAAGSAGGASDLAHRRGAAEAGGRRRGAELRTRRQQAGAVMPLSGFAIVRVSHRPGAARRAPQRTLRRKTTMAMKGTVHYEKKDDIALLTVDNPPVNPLSSGVRQGLHDGVNRALDDDEVKALVITGAGRAFIAGADISEFGAAASEGPGLHEVLDLMENSSKPIVAAINGTAFGGGLEVALCCDYRVAAKAAPVGLPEVKLGLLPGAGGTQRLPRLIGAAQALKFILSGDPIPAPQALTLGIVDRVIDSDIVAGAIDYARQVVAEGGRLRKIRDEDDRIAADRDNPDIFAEARRNAARRMRGRFAPEMIIQCVEAAVNLGDFDAGMEVEQENFQKCLQHPQREALIHVFFAEREVAKIPDVPRDTPTKPIESAGVVGCGTMGGGITMCFANAGIPVTVLEMNQEALDKGLGVIRRNYDIQVQRGRMTAEEVGQRMGLITGTVATAISRMPTW